MAYSQRPEHGGGARRKVPGWLIGVAVTLGGIVLLGVGLVIGGTWFFRDAMQAFEQADSSMEVVAERFGPIPQFRPAPEGVIPPERVEIFLASRESVAPAREQVERALSVLSDEDQAGAVRKTVAGFGLLRNTADFITQRNTNLLDSSMGLGEYYYLYVLAYYSWLGKSPTDGPSFRLVNEHGYVLDTVFAGTPEEEVLAYRDEQVRTSLNRLLLPLLKNQLTDLASSDGELEQWKEKLAAEVEALEADGLRIPWEDGVPETIASSLDSYRNRIVEGYSPMCNALEVGLARR